jgi:hypothetical protein
MTTTKQKHYYVYALVDPRPESLQSPIFYIGKGRATRKSNHFTRLPGIDKRENASPKAKTIQAILDAGLKPTAIVISHHRTESGALKAESSYIKSRLRCSPFGR